MAGTHSVQADDLRIQGIPRSWQTVAITNPQYGAVLEGFPPASREDPPSARDRSRGANGGCYYRYVLSEPLSCACSPEHLGASQTCCRHRMWALGSVPSPLRSKGTGSLGLRPPPSPTPLRGEGWVGRRCAPLRVSEAGDQQEAMISLVNGISQTNHSTNQKRPCTTVHRIKKGQSTCPSPPCSDAVTFPVLGQIKPQTPRLVVSFRQFL